MEAALLGSGYTLSLPAERAESRGSSKDTEGAVLSARTVTGSPLTFGSGVVAGQAACVQQSSPHPQADEPRPSSVRRDSMKPSARPFPRQSAQHAFTDTVLFQHTCGSQRPHYAPKVPALDAPQYQHTDTHTHKTCPATEINPRRPTDLQHIIHV